MTLRLRYAAASDVGLLRDGNEDSVYAGPRLLAVADGMGGAAAGEVASSVTIATLAGLDDDAPGLDLISALQVRVEAANRRLADLVRGDDALDGMGTTVTALLHAGQRAGLVHVGDSRAYLLRDGRLSQITHDHTLVQDLVDEGRITAEQAGSHPQRSLLTRVLDGRPVQLDVSVREVRPGDRYLLCTDGLSGVLSDDTIRDALSGPDPQAAVDRLIELALRGGGPDNVTCIVAEVIEDDVDPGLAPVVAGAAADVVEPLQSPDTPAGRAALATGRRSHRRGPHRAAEARAGIAGPSTILPPVGRLRHSRRTLLVAAVLTVALAAGGAGAWAYVRSQYFVWAVGAGSGRMVAIYRGVHGSVAGLSLSSVHSRSLVPIDALPAFERERVQEGISAASLLDAARIVAELTHTACAPNTAVSAGSTGVAPLPATTQTPAAVSPSVRPSPSARPSPSQRPTPRPSPSARPTPVYCSAGTP